MERKNKKTKVFKWAAVLCVFAAILLGCKTNVTTSIAVTGVTLDKATVTLIEQETVTLKATVKPANAANKKVTWSSDKPDVAAVDKDGKVTAHKAGEATITVTTTDGGKTASCKVTVTAKAPPTPTYVISFSVDGTGGTLKAKADGVTETDKSPISVEKDKTVTFTAKPADGYEVEKWTVNGTAVANNVSTTYSHKVTTAVMVKVSFKALPPAAVAVTGVTLDKATVTLIEQETVTLKATVKPANAANKKVTWSSDKPDVAAVDKDGKVTAHKAGEATITVTTTDGGKTASCKVTVTAKAPPTPTYVISFSVDGTGGTLKAKADGVTETETSPITIEQGKTVTFTARANSDYVVDKWTISGSSFESGSGTDGSTTAKVKVTADTTVNVTFKSVTPPTPPASTDKTYTVGGISFTMKGIAAVTNGTVGRSGGSNNVVHTVSLTAYRIGESEATQELWQAVMSNNPSYFQGSGGLPASGEVQEKRPVESVNWYECIAFCNELTKKVAELGESQCVYSVEGHIYGTADAVAKKVPEMDMSKKGFRLPTEAEWEWAAKGGTEYKWAGTNERSKLENYAWYSANSNNQTHEVKKKQPNGYGLYDMSGNVWEWCWDWYSSSTPTGGQDPTGAASGDYRVFRGGSWFDGAVGAARASRDHSDPDIRSFHLGLRLVSRP